MGIQGLLPFLEKATKPCHISEFRGSTAVIDTYCWLHKGATTCAIQLAQGEETHLYVNYCLKYVKMLQSFDIRPILVFDGKNLPAKAGTEAKRRESRAKAKQKAAELLSRGKMEEARSYLKASLNITPEMASTLIKECQKIKVDCIVAPYESDAQLALFNLRGIAQIVITEDSDLILFGCSKILYKLDLKGCGYLVDTEKICSAMSIHPDKYTFDKFRHMCILSGCDYVDSLQGIGLKKAQKFIALTNETNPEIFLDKIPRYLKMHSLEVTEEYKINFMKADATFRHQIVFDPFKKQLVPLFDPHVVGTNPSYCENAGEIYDHGKAYQVALGNLHPSSFKKLNDWDPKKADLSNKSIWFDGKYERSVSRNEQKQAAVFKEYFNKTKLEAISEVDDQKLKIEEDNRIRKELEFYSKPIAQLENVEQAVKTEITIENEDNQTSPVLKKNPFIRRFSKFQRTETESSLIVKSRYFSPKNIEAQNVLAIENNHENIKETETNEETNDEISNGYMHKSSMTNNICLPETAFSALELEDTKYELILKESKYFTSCQQQDTVQNISNAKRKILGGGSGGHKKFKSQGQLTLGNFFKKCDKPL